MYLKSAFGRTVKSRLVGTDHRRRNLVVAVQRGDNVAFSAWDFESILGLSERSRTASHRLEQNAYHQHLVLDFHTNIQ